MADTLTRVGNTPALLCAPEGPSLRGERDALDLIGQTWEHDTALVVVPVERLGDDFFRLRTGAAGEIAQKFANYRRRLAVVGDITEHVAAGTAFGDFVREANRGDQMWFVADLAELAARLDPPGAP